MRSPNSWGSRIHPVWFGAQVTFAAVYARYSSSLQRPTSIGDQLALCRQAATRLGLEILDDHVYTDEEVSGAVRQRQGYLRLIDAARTRAIDAIVVESQDRLWRDQAEMHAALRRLHFWGVKVYSVDAGAELTERTGKLIASVMGWKDEAYLEDLREKVRRGMLGQVQRGFSPGGRPYGYRTEAITDQSRTDHYGRPLVIGSRRVIDPEEAAVVRRIFEMFTSGLSPDAIVQQLNRDGVPAPRWRGAGRMPGWVPSTIRGQRKLAFGILRNPVYVGKLLWNRAEKVRDPDTGRRVWRLRPSKEWVHVDLPELRIIPEDLWAAAQRRLDSTPYGPKKAGRKPLYLLSGLCVCGKCGASYVMTGGRQWYGCGNYHRRGTIACTNRLLAKRQLLEEEILALVQKSILAPEAIDEFVRHFNRTLSERIGRHIAAKDRQRRELSRAQKELENVKDAIRAGLVTPTTKRMLEEAELKLQRLSTEAPSQGPTQATISVLPKIVARFARDLGRLARHDVPKARAALEAFLGRIVLKQKDDALVAVVQGNLAALLPIETRSTNNRGAGGRT